MLPDLRSSVLGGSYRWSWKTLPHWAFIVRIRVASSILCTSSLFPLGLSWLGQYSDTPASLSCADKDKSEFHVSLVADLEPVWSALQAHDKQLLAIQALGV